MMKQQQKIRVVVNGFKLLANVRPTRSDRRISRLILPGGKQLAAKTAIVQSCIQKGVPYRWYLSR